jgi:putative ABC transport system substrate-binding protein
VKRRDFITLLGGAAAARPCVSRAQQATLPVIGFIIDGSVDAWRDELANFRRGLAETGYVEGRNVAIEYRASEGQNDKLPGLAVDLVRGRVRVIAGMGSTVALRVAKAVTSTIPIVFAMRGDPVQVHITGSTVLARDQLQIRLQLLHDVVPTANVFGLIVNPDNLGAVFTPGDYVSFGSTWRMPVELAQETVSSWGGGIEIAQARTVGDFDAAFASLAEKRVNALTTQSDPLFRSGYERLLALAARYAIPMNLDVRGLVSYTTNATDSYRQAGRYAGRILKGEKPADIR